MRRKEQHDMREMRTHMTTGTKTGTEDERRDNDDVL